MAQTIICLYMFYARMTKSDRNFVDINTVSVIVFRKVQQYGRRLPT